MVTSARYLAALVAAALAATLAAIAPALIADLNDGADLGDGLADQGASIIFWVALAHASVLGLPTAVLLQLMERANILAAVGAGFLIGALPIGLLMTLSSSAQYASIGGVVTDVDGVRTAGGWMLLLKSAGTLGLDGAAGGLAAWIVWRWSARASWLWLLAAVAAVVALLAGSAHETDLSCHNPVRDGRRSIGPEVVADLSITQTDWPELAEMFESHARSIGWSFRNSTTVDPIPILDLSLCSEPGTVIWAMQQIWVNAPAHMQGQPVPIILYQPQGGGGWEGTIQPLLEAIERRWPDQLVFTGPMGERIDPPEWMRSSP